jgi:SAM-dependent methyltransferase
MGQKAGDRRPRRHPRNQLNDLTGTDWIKFTKTWFELGSDADPERLPIEAERSWLIVDSRRYHKNRDTELHPARYPEELVREFLLFFTKKGEWVLDPFAGSGATLVACLETGRNGVGVELSPKYAAVSQRRIARGSLESVVAVKQGDAARVGETDFWGNAACPGLPVGDGGLPTFDFVMTSPPYWDMLRHSRGGVESTHKKRAKRGLDTVYSDDPADLGNTETYEEFIRKLCGILSDAGRLVRPGRYLVVVAQNLRAPGGEVVPLAWDIQRGLDGPLQFQGERIWCQNSKSLGIWGYPKVFVPNYHHHYCLIFRRPGK